MCQHQTLYYQENIGYVINCQSCNKIQVGFNILSATFDKIGFQKFRDQVLKANNNKQEGINSSVKSVFIPTPCEGLNLLLTVTELELLLTMLEHADNEMKAQEIIKEFTIT
jgi:hypothetical protein